MAAEATSLLLVDDDQVFRERLARALRERGFDVRTASDARSARALAEADSPELAVVDLRMPGGNGLDLVRDLHALDPGTRVIVLTGYGSIATAVDAMKLGAAHFMPKPADADDLCAVFARLDAPHDPLATAASTSDTELRAPTLARAEWEHIHRVLSDAGGNVSEAARRLGLHRRSLQRKLAKFAP